jgi:hypothetical protein
MYCPVDKTAMTDSRHYSRLSPSGTLRWAPLVLNKQQGDINRIHGVNERISIQHFACGLATYKTGLKAFGDYVGVVQAEGQGPPPSQHHQQDPRHRQEDEEQQQQQLTTRTSDADEL